MSVLINNKIQINRNTYKNNEDILLFGSKDVVYRIELDKKEFPKFYIGSHTLNSNYSTWQEAVNMDPYFTKKGGSSKHPDYQKDLKNYKVKKITLISKHENYDFAKKYETNLLINLRENNSKEYYNMKNKIGSITNFTDISYIKNLYYRCMNTDEFIKTITIKEYIKKFLGIQTRDEGTIIEKIEELIEGHRTNYIISGEKLSINQLYENNLWELGVISTNAFSLVNIDTMKKVLYGGNHGLVFLQKLAEENNPIIDLNEKIKYIDIPHECIAGMSKDDFIKIFLPMFNVKEKKQKIENSRATHLGTLRAMGSNYEDNIQSFYDLYGTSYKYIKGLIKTLKTQDENAVADDWLMKKNRIFEPLSNTSLKLKAIKEKYERLGYTVYIVSTSSQKLFENFWDHLIRQSEGDQSKVTKKMYLFYCTDIKHYYNWVHGLKARVEKDFMFAKKFFGAEIFNFEDLSYLQEKVFDQSAEKKPDPVKITEFNNLKKVA